jgi:predicted methyltransferase
MTAQPDFNCYNIAFEYLKKKYGNRRLRLTHKSEALLRSQTVKKQKELLEGFTDRNYVVQLNPIGEEDKVIWLLIEQYYCSITVRKELYYKLVSLGEINLAESN